MTMKARLITAAIGALALTAAPSAFAHDHTPRANVHARTAPTIVAVAAGNPDFSTLVAAVQAAGLVDTLNGGGPFTVFAPTNSAFGALPHGTVSALLQPNSRPTLTNILTYHVVSGRITAADLATAVRVGGGSATLKTVQGGELRVSARNRSLRLTDASGEHIDIVAADVEASNGIIHVVGSVLSPN